MDNQVSEMLRGQVLEILIDAAFLVLGMTSVAVAAIRRRSGVRTFLWLGIWSAAYGALHILAVRPVVLALPQRVWPLIPYAIVAIVYSLLVIASLAWLNLLTGIVRRILFALIVCASITAVLGIGWFVATGVNNQFMRLNNLLASCVLILLIVVLVSKRLFKRYLLLPSRGFLVFGTLVFAFEALCVNLTRPLGLRTPVVLDHLGFMVLLVAFGYSALRMVLSNEHRLLAIDSELEVARQIQSSILPTELPQVRGLSIAAIYQPMTAVAGDFYEFLAVDRDHAGFLVADVCGHGVPAALIASMLKVAVQTAAAFADNPARFLAALNRILAGPLRGQLVSAAYLWVDMEHEKALYSAAGHPPLLCWNAQGLQHIESNGLLFGVAADAGYPVREISLKPGDRLLLYTDGIIEPEDLAGSPFGDRRLEEVLRASESIAASELSGRVVAEIRKWQPDVRGQQDDMTLIVIDVTQWQAVARASEPSERVPTACQ